MNWQPIETAPKDETYVLLYFAPDGPRPWQAEETGGVVIGFWSEVYNAWYDSECAGHWLCGPDAPPSYWMSLPEPPAPPDAMRSCTVVSEQEMGR